MNTKFNCTIAICVTLLVLMSGCDKRHDVERKDIDFSNLNNSQLLPQDEYDDINALVGDVTTRDLFDMVATDLDILSTSAAEGYTSEEDYQTLLNIVVNLRDLLGRLLNPAMEDSEGLVDHLGLLLGLLVEAPAEGQADCRIGTLMDSVLLRLEPDVLSSRVYPLLQYVMDPTDDALGKALAGLQLGELTAEDEARFKTMMVTLHTALKYDAEHPENSSYGAVYKGILDLYAALQNVEGSKITISTVTPLLTDATELGIGDLLNAGSGMLALAEAVDTSYTPEGGEPVANYYVIELLTSVKNLELNTTINTLLDILIGVCNDGTASIDQTDLQNLVRALHTAAIWLNQPVAVVADGEPPAPTHLQDLRGKAESLDHLVQATRPDLIAMLGTLQDLDMSTLFPTTPAEQAGLEERLDNSLSAFIKVMDNRPTEITDQEAADLVSLLVDGAHWLASPMSEGAGETHLDRLCTMAGTMDELMKHVSEATVEIDGQKYKYDAVLTAARDLDLGAFLSPQTEQHLDDTIDLLVLMQTGEAAKLTPDHLKNAAALVEDLTTWLTTPAAPGSSVTNAEELRELLANVQQLPAALKKTDPADGETGYEHLVALLTGIKDLDLSAFVSEATENKLHTAIDTLTGMLGQQSLAAAINSVDKAEVDNLVTLLYQGATWLSLNTEQINQLLTATDGILDAVDADLLEAVQALDMSAFVNQATCKDIRTALEALTDVVAADDLFSGLALLDAQELTNFLNLATEGVKWINDPKYTRLADLVSLGTGATALLESVNKEAAGELVSSLSAMDLCNLLGGELEGLVDAMLGACAPLFTEEALTSADLQHLVDAAANLVTWLGEGERMEDLSLVLETVELFKPADLAAILAALKPLDLTAFMSAETDHAGDLSLDFLGKVLTGKSGDITQEEWEALSTVVTAFGTWLSADHDAEHPGTSNLAYYKAALDALPRTIRELGQAPGEGQDVDMLALCDEIVALDLSDLLTVDQETRIDDLVRKARAFMSTNDLASGLQAVSGQQSTCAALIDTLQDLVETYVALITTSDGNPTPLDTGLLAEIGVEAAKVFTADNADGIQARQSLADLLSRAGLLLSSPQFSGLLTDAQGLLADDENILDLDYLLAKLDPTLRCMPAASNPDRTLLDEVGDILAGLGMIDPKGLAGVDAGLEYMITHDKYGTSIDASATRESALVSLIKAMQNADVALNMSVTAFVFGVAKPISMDALSVVYPQDGDGNDITKDPTMNISQWLVSEIVRAIKFRWSGPEYNLQQGGAPQTADYNDDKTVDCTEAMYWLFWKKHYHVSYSMVITFTADYYGILNFSFMKLGNITDMISYPGYGTDVPAVWTYAMDLGAPVQFKENAGTCKSDAYYSTPYPGRVRDVIPALAALGGWKYEASDIDPSSTDGNTNPADGDGHVKAVTPASDPASEAPEHQLMALMFPLMEYFWEQRELKEDGTPSDRPELDNMVSLLAGLLEGLEDQSGFMAATDDTTCPLLEALQGPAGNGLLYKLVSDHGQGGVLDPVLIMGALLGKNLENAGYIDQLMAELNKPYQKRFVVTSPGNATLDDVDEVFIDTLTSSDKARTLAMDAGRAIDTNHAALVRITSDLGRVLIYNKDTLTPCLNPNDADGSAARFLSTNDGAHVGNLVAAANTMLGSLETAQRNALFTNLKALAGDASPRELFNRLWNTLTDANAARIKGMGENLAALDDGHEADFLDALKEILGAGLPKDLLTKMADFLDDNTVTFKPLMHEVQEFCGADGLSKNLGTLLGTGLGGKALTFLDTNVDNGKLTPVLSATETTLTTIKKEQVGATLASILHNHGIMNLAAGAPAFLTAENTKQLAHMTRILGQNKTEQPGLVLQLTEKTYTDTRAHLVTLLGALPEGDLSGLLTTANMNRLDDLSDSLVDLTGKLDDNDAALLGWTLGLALDPASLEKLLAYLAIKPIEGADKPTRQELLNEVVTDLEALCANADKALLADGLRKVLCFDLLGNADTLINLGEHGIAVVYTGKMDAANYETGLDPLVATLIEDDSDTYKCIQTVWNDGKTLARAKEDLATLQPVMDKIMQSAGTADAAPLIDRLLNTTDGKPNPFLTNATALTCQLLDIQHPEYNKNGTLDKDAALLDIAATALNYYNQDGRLKNAYNLIYTLTDLHVDPADPESPYLLWVLAHDGLGAVDEVMGEERLSLSFVQSLFAEIPMDGRDQSVVFTIFELLDIEPLVSGERHTADLILEMQKLMNGFSSGSGDTALLEMLYDTLNFVISSSTVE